MPTARVSPEGEKPPHERLLDLLKSSPELANTPIKDLPPERQREALRPITQMLESSVKAVMDRPFAEIVAALQHPNDLQKLRGFLLDWTPLLTLDNPLHGKTVANASTELLVGIEEKMASVRADTAPRKDMKRELYELLTDETYVAPRVTKALEQLIGYNFIDNPFDVGAIKYIRKNTDIFNPPSTDEGCMLLFNIPMREGEVQMGLTPEERRFMGRIGVLVEFDKAGNVTSVREHTPLDGRKAFMPFEAFIDVVPPKISGGEVDYYYRRISFDKVDLTPEELSLKSRQVVQLGARVGMMRSMDGDEIRVYELKNEGDVKALSLGSDRIGLVTNRTSDVVSMVRLTENPCVQASVGDVKIGINVESKDAGVHLKKTVDEAVNEVAVKIMASNPLAGDYLSTKREVALALDELVRFVPPLQLEDPDEIRRDKRRFMKTVGNVIPYLINLRRSVEGLPPEEKKRIPEEILTFSYANFYKANLLIRAGGRAFTPVWALESLENFLIGYNELNEMEVRNAMKVGRLTTADAEFIAAEVRKSEERVMKHVTKEAEETRRRVASLSTVVVENFDKLKDGQKKVDDIAEALPDIIAGLEAIGVDVKDVKEAVTKKKGAKFVFEAGFKTWILSAKVQKEFEVAQVARTVKDKFKLGVEKLKGVFSAIRKDLTEAGVAEQYVRQFDEL